MQPNSQNNLDFIDPAAPSAEEVKRLHPMVVLRPGERVIAEIKRHPIGIMATYLGGALSIVLIIVVAIMAPTIFSGVGLEDNFATAAIILALILSVGICAIMFIATTVYWQNRWIVTDDSITQITQHSLLGRRVSQLSLESLEDITVDQHGLLQTMFNFGTLHAETAGEKSKFVFPYCPKPSKRARQILEAHEYFLHQTKHQPQPVSPAAAEANETVQVPHTPEQQAYYQQQQQYAQPQYSPVPPPSVGQPPQQYGTPQQPQQEYQQQPWQQQPAPQAMPQAPYSFPAQPQQQTPPPIPPHFPQDQPR